ncbi:hypothetical protein [Bifidobacterium moukalabense]|jgi:hypothetical protein|uniref:Uncharacterized protein n=1 Tax=Bifidobacterium moukalabense DSM 27321 TaxID=1435051 RepID=W4NAX6_9BIFI|nr:hypothetical protein [Bifidobacterium moukalabense]ETY72227.1 hypothetical protein BMOU_0241 [Bifidobacterium moukalabense DSM 27321]
MSNDIDTSAKRLELANQIRERSRDIERRIGELTAFMSAQLGDDDHAVDELCGIMLDTLVKCAKHAHHLIDEAEALDHADRREEEEHMRALAMRRTFERMAGGQ